MSAHTQPEGKITVFLSYHSLFRIANSGLQLRTRKNTMRSSEITMRDYEITMREHDIAMQITVYIAIAHQIAVNVV